MTARSSYFHKVNYAGFQNASYGITVGYAGEVHFTTDGGQTWQYSGNTSACLYGLDIVDEKVSVNCGNQGHVRLTTDGAATWTGVDDFGPAAPGHCRFLSFVNSTTGWAATPSQLAVTADGGETWTDVKLPEGIRSITAISLVKPEMGYLLDAIGVLYTTTDGAQSWASQKVEALAKADLKTTVSPYAAMRFMDEQHGVIAYVQGNLDDGYATYASRTDDGGVTWITEKTPMPAGMPNLYLSHDGLTLTGTSVGTNEITVLSYQ